MIYLILIQFNEEGELAMKGEFSQWVGTLGNCSMWSARMHQRFVFAITRLHSLRFIL
jgi:hypothetical protein